MCLVVIGLFREETNKSVFILRLSPPPCSPKSALKDVISNYSCVPSDSVVPYGSIKVGVVKFTTVAGHLHCLRNRPHWHARFQGCSACNRARGPGPTAPARRCSKSKGSFDPLSDSSHRYLDLRHIPSKPSFCVANINLRRLFPQT